MADWPATIPWEFLTDGASGGFGDNALRSSMDVGPAKLRRRSTAAPDRFTGDLLITATQYGYIDTFYKTTLGYGALPFDGLHPVTGAAAEMQFLAPPACRPTDSFSGGERIWIATLQLEILP